MNAHTVNLELDPVLHAQLHSAKGRIISIQLAKSNHLNNRTSAT
jgi:hypothetical protein